MKSLEGKHMRTPAKILRSAFLGISLCTIGSVTAFGGMAPAQTINLPSANDGYTVQDDDAPEITARVARISFIRGEAQIRRAESEEWERATLNLPIVEGDEIATDNDSRVEIQFDSQSHLRLDENSFFKVSRLGDEGIAVSLSIGTASVNLITFDADQGYFEMDAPRTTVAVQKAGTYRIDAGDRNGTEVRVIVTDGGEARVYSDNAGFALKNGRSAIINIDGPNAGDWRAGKAASYTDEFDEWAAQRDVVIAKRLKDAYYDRYYDRDIYGADDLNDYGDWVHTASYGYVWRPHRSSISRYADWSPYRYGHWRWMSPFGWIWVNDEPWGWATYHHGRWIYDAGYWYWSPYGYYRSTRSWWYPALVAINIYNSNVCWYPLPYNRRYHRYNGHGPRGPSNSGNPIPPGTGGVKPIPNRTPTGQAKFEPNGGVMLPPETKVPPKGVVVVSTDEFGVKTKGFKTASVSVATAVLASPGGPQSDLPTFTAVRRKAGSDISVDRPKAAAVVKDTKVGAAPRKTDAPLDKELQRTRVLVGRPPVAQDGDTGGTKPPTQTEPRKLGAVDRPPVVRQEDPRPPARQAPVYTPPVVVKEEPQKPAVRQPRSDPSPVRPDPPAPKPPVRQPREDPAPVKPAPRYDPPPTRQPPRADPAPVKPAPRNDPPPRKQPEPAPPAKSEPKPDRKPSKSDEMAD